MVLSDTLTESVNPRTIHIDQRSPLEIIGLMLDEDRYITEAIEKEKKRISHAVELIVQRFSKGGRLIFIGAGTSGRLGVIEAAECPPTFGTDPSLVLGLIAGGSEALHQSVEGAEDSRDEAKERLIEIALNEKDILVGIAASSTTPFVQSALYYAGEIGSARIFITCNPVKVNIADVTISLLVGPEVIVGSTRMKAGTATKTVLNMLTTASMVKLGKTYGNLMVDVQPKSAKLRDRAKRIVTFISKVDMEKAEELLLQSDWNVKAAVLMAIKGMSCKEAKWLLVKHDGVLRKALE